MTSTAAATAATTSASTATSQVTARTSAPAGASARSSSAAASTRAWVRPAIVTDAPSRRRCRAQASPMPLPPPVMNPDCPASASSAIVPPLLVVAVTLGAWPAARRCRVRPPRPAAATGRGARARTAPAGRPPRGGPATSARGHDADHRRRPPGVEGAQLVVAELEQHLHRPHRAVTAEVANGAARQTAERTGRGHQPGVLHPPGRHSHGRSLPGVAPDPLPRSLAPMKATAGELPTGEGWSYEVKWDGMRALAFVQDGELRIGSANERDVTVSWPELAGLPDGAAGGRRAPRRRAGGHRRGRPPELRPPPAAHARGGGRRRRPAGPPRCRSPTWCSTSSTSTATRSSTSR